MTSRALSPPRMPEVRTLGILGNRQTDSEKEVWGILEAIAETIGRRPDRILIPAEGNFSIYTQSWADSKKIQYTLFECDWIRLGKRAAVMRDMAIQKEADHFLLVRSTRPRRVISERSPQSDGAIKSPKGKSDRLDKLAATFARKHIQVFLLGEELEEVEVTITRCDIATKPSRGKVSPNKPAARAPAGKSENEITSWLLK